MGINNWKMEMKTKVLALVVLCLAGWNMATAQAHSCGVTHAIEEYQKNSPEEYSKRLTKYNAFIAKNVRALKARKSAGDNETCPNGLTIIPIAFNVFHNGDAIGTGKNFSRDDLRMVVDRLNADFSGYSALKDQITGEFNSFESGHTCIQFAIGKINRINTNDCPYWNKGALHNTLHQCLPGGSGVGSDNDPNDYLNIYITDLKSGYLGVASSIPPLYGQANSDDDGVTINWNIVIPGKNPNSLYNRGSVLSHEIGHWLGLPHVNGDINGRGCGADDGFTDTYPQSDQRFYSCGSAEIPQSCGSVDNIFNYMDYSADCAKLMFTEEQAMTMQKVLETERKGLSTSFKRGNEDRDLYNTTCRTFEANSSLFEFAVMDCHGEINFLDYQTKWYPSAYSADGSGGGLTLFTWVMENRGETAEVIAKNELAKRQVAHNSGRYTDVDIYNLYVQCWDPYQEVYTEKQLAGRVMSIIRKCETPENDEMEGAFDLSFGIDCFEESYVLNSATANQASYLSCSDYSTRADVWFKTMAPEQSGMEIKAIRTSGATANPVIEVYYMRNGKLTCANNTVASTLEMTDLIPGEELYFRVFNKAVEDEGTFTICLSQVALQNNTCATAVPLAVNTNCSAKVYHNFGATASGYPSNKAVCGRTDNAKDIWFEVEVPRSGNVYVESFKVDGGVDEIIMEAYAGACGDITPIACSSIKEYYPNYDRHGLVEITDRTPGEKILIRIFGNGSVDEGEFKLCAYDGGPQTSCRINLIETVSQSDCQGADNMYTQTIRVHYRNAGANEYIYVNNQPFRVTGSPQLITLTELQADGKVVNVTANIGNSSDDLCWQQSFYKSYSLWTAPNSCLDASLPNDDCEGAIALSVGTSCQRQYFSNVGATYSTAVKPYFGCGASGYKPSDVWFTATVPASGNLVVSAPLLFNGNNMILEAYYGDCSELVQFACDQFGGSKGSELVFEDRAPGEVLYIRVADQGSNTQGEFAMCAYDPGVTGAYAGAASQEAKDWYYDEETQEIVQIENNITEENNTEVKPIFDEAISMSVYPNPTSDYLNINLAEGVSADTQISILDFTGALIKVVDTAESSAYSQTIEINLNDLPTGQYYVNVRSENFTKTEAIQIIK